MLPNPRKRRESPTDKKRMSCQKAKATDYINVRAVEIFRARNSGKRMVIVYKAVYYEVQIKCNGCFVCA